MKYSIVVAQEGASLFSTTWDDSRERTKALLTLFYEKFPRREGYECVVYDETRPLHEAEILDFATRQANPAGPDPLSLEDCPHCGRKKPRNDFSACEECQEKFLN